jgi:hypothetical protein
MGSMHVLNEQGHITLSWDPDDKKSVKKAETEFNALRTAGYEAYTGEGRKKKRVDSFDPAVGTYIVAPGAAHGKTARASKPSSPSDRPKAMAGGPTSRTVRL